MQENRAHSTAKKRAAAKADNGGGPLLAVLDLGTNNCRLLIARPDAAGPVPGSGFFSRIVRLGEGVGETGLLSEAAMDRTIAALKVCAERIARHRVRHVRAIATQAARQAANTDVLIARAQEEAGIALAVISPDEEADLAALGCAPLIGRKYQGRPDVRYRRRLDRDRVAAKRGRQNRRDALPPRCRWAWSIWRRITAPPPAAGPASNACCKAMTGRFGAFRGRMKGFDPARQHLLGTSGTVTTLAAHRAQAAALQSRQSGCELA